MSRTCPYIILAAGLLLLIIGCKHRDLYVYGDEFQSVVLDVDWRNYDATRDPDGMTVWFYSLDDPTRSPYRNTTANVRSHQFYLPSGSYQGVVIDYSPEEYSRQGFFALESASTARVESLPASYQPGSTFVTGEGVSASVNRAVCVELFGEAAWTDLQKQRPEFDAATGLYTVADQPEPMALDTLSDCHIFGGEYGDYIPYEQRDSYQSTLTLQRLHSEPESIIWHLRVRIHIKEGFNYLWQQMASISGFADGHLLARHRNTERSSLLSITDWELQRTGTNEGYLAATLTTFGLRPSSVRPDAEHHTSRSQDEGSATDDSRSVRAAGDTEAGTQPDDWWDYTSDVCLPGDLRLNLSLVLRDHATVFHYHFDVGGSVVAYDHQLVMRIDLEPEIVLPYVDSYSGAGFGADVTPWEEEEPLDISM